MHANDKYFYFPPYISTSWDHIAALYVKGLELQVALTSGQTISIPNLNPEELLAIFKAHSHFLEREIIRKRKSNIESKQDPKNFPFFNEEGKENASIRFGFGAMDGYGSALQHNPEQANAPKLPDEVIAKIAQVTKILAPDELSLLPQPEPNCNCFHCQIARAVRENLAPKTSETEPTEEIVNDEDLNFQQWEITQAGDKLFNVVNKLDPQENYRVFLGQPVGCTCGKSGCEHLLIVLKS